MILLYGPIIYTSGICTACGKDDDFHKFVKICLHRHRLGDWGDLCEEDKDINAIALLIGKRILSRYELPRELIGFGHSIWIITDADRSVTTVLFPSEY